MKPLLAFLAALALVIAVPQTAQAAKPKDIFEGGLYVQSDSEAAVASATLTDHVERKAAKYIAKRPVAIWLGDWYDGKELTSYIKRNLVAAKKKGKTVVFVTYALPDRDCGGHSAGGFSAAHYLKWNARIAKALKGSDAVVLIEPDSLSTLNSCPVGTEQVRTPLLKKAVTQFTKAKVPTYLDGGISNAVDPATMAALLKKSGIAKARGFFTNVANYRATADEIGYANTLSALTGNAHYVIDTSRNGTGYHGEWCNSPEAGLGADPKVASGTTKLDALLWVKTPGASDGTCQGGPNAGSWFASFAVQLYKNRAR
jgi:endoglucanase